MEYASMESSNLLLWAARNGLNVWAGRGATLPLAAKLGMTIKRGGHIFESILHPDARLPDGRILWDAHPEWFGLSADGGRRREAAQRTQFCAAHSEVFDVLGDALVRRLRGEWSAAGRVTGCKTVQRINAYQWVDDDDGSRGESRNRPPSSSPSSTGMVKEYHDEN